jgi:hypothetical protein
MVSSPTVQTFQAPILLLPWVCFRGSVLSKPQFSLGRPRARLSLSPCFQHSVEVAALQGTCVQLEAALQTTTAALAEKSAEHAAVAAELTDTHTRLAAAAAAAAAATARAEAAETAEAVAREELQAAEERLAVATAAAAEAAETATGLLEQLNDAMAEDTSGEEAAAAVAAAEEAAADALAARAELKETQTKAKHALHTKSSQLKAEADKVSAPLTVGDGVSVSPRLSRLLIIIRSLRLPLPLRR